MTAFSLCLTSVRRSTFSNLPPLSESIKPDYFLSEVGELGQVGLLTVTDNRGWSEMKITVRNHQPYQTRRHDKTIPSSENGGKTVHKYISAIIEVSLCYVMI